jgi:hypothetical protein
MIDDCLHEIPKGIESAQIAEVRRRIAEVESGKVALISADEVFAAVRRILASESPEKRTKEKGISPHNKLANQRPR